MNTLELETTYVPHLKRQFSVASPVLFLGSGFSLAAKNVRGEHIPSVNSLRKKLWKLCFPSEEFDNTTELQDIYDTANLNHQKHLASLLKEEFTVKTQSWPDWYKTILTMPWRRIYTLNIDNLVEAVLSEKYNTRRFVSISATTSNELILQKGELPIIHLNGVVDDAPDGITFSRSQYAQRRGLDPIYSQLANDFRFRPIVFVGSSLDEDLFWAHLELRGVKNRRQGPELRQRSYLIVPELNRSREALLGRYNVVWLKMTAEELAKVFSNFSKERKDGHYALRDEMSSSYPTRFSTVYDLAQRSTQTEEYLLGAEPTWKDVDSGRIAHRVCFDTIWKQINFLRAAPREQRIIVVTGTAGVGKTSALMVLAMRLSSEGLTVGWMDRDIHFDRRNFRNAISQSSNLDALFINDADVYGHGLSEMIREAIERKPRLILLCEIRSSKIDQSIQNHVLQDIDLDEYTVPNLGDDDIEAILDVLEKEHRLGELKGKTRTARRAVFQKQAGRQMLVAMHIATSGRSFEEKVHDELQSMTEPRRYIYGLISVATAHRFALRREDIGLAYANHFDIDWLRLLNELERRKLVIGRGNLIYVARHRVVAQFAYDSLVERGQLGPITYGLIRIGATKTTENTPRNAMPARLLRSFLNHDYLMRVGVPEARTVYNTFEDALAWNYHFWLHRGALEVEQGDLGLAENFLRQASAINPGDVFVDTELAYLMMKKANESPGTATGSELVEDALNILDGVVVRRSDQAAHAYHIAATQGLLWAGSIQSRKEALDFLSGLKSRAEKGVRLYGSKILQDALEDIKKAILRMAVHRNI